MRARAEDGGERRVERHPAKPLVLVRRGREVYGAVRTLPRLHPMRRVDQQGLDQAARWGREVGTRVAFEAGRALSMDCLGDGTCMRRVEALWVGWVVVQGVNLDGLQTWEGSGRRLKLAATRI